MTDITIHWGVEVPPDQMADFIELLSNFATYIDLGDSLKEVRIVTDDAFISEVQLWAGESYQPGSHFPLGVAVAVEQGDTFSSKIFIRQAFFTPDEKGPLEQRSTVLEELYHCRLYEQTWQRRGYIYPHFADPYSNNLFGMCQTMHDEYAVARLKNVFFAWYPLLYDVHTGQRVPWFVEYGASLTECLDQTLDQLPKHENLHLVPAVAKNTLLLMAYRSIFEPLARHAGFLASIPPDYQLQAPDNSPEGSVFYQKVVVPYWVQIKSALEASFDSQFNETEKALQTISETVDACLERLLELLYEISQS